MFREMRRRGQELSVEECERILARGTSGVLALAGDDGYPYAVPLSYVYADGRIIFHCARSGHKLDAIARSPKASLCVIDRDEVVPERYTTLFRSVIVFGRVGVVGDPGEMRRACMLLAEKYRPDGTVEQHEAEIERGWDGLCVLELVPEHMSGKEAVELSRARRARK